MAQQLLDVPQRRSRLQQMRSIAVPQRIHGTERIEPLRCSIVVIVLQGIHGTGRIEPLRCSIVVIVLQGIPGTGRIEPLRCSIVVIVLQGIHGTGRIEPRSSYRHFVNHLYASIAILPSTLTFKRLIIGLIILIYSCRA
jgi:hypothetical protein